jgi:hypothetical protein
VREHFIVLCGDGSLVKEKKQEENRKKKKKPHMKKE